ncbi:hypothetical protein [Thiomicrorhabdus sp.]|uniref:hypothetical protein n=1 Tax=Thiomicrorhabdus sp. TaxID=2039724 RepID=UPI0029C7E427|nr:hypothetical protein [Thiomicrorhabdus sp.]
MKKFQKLSVAFLAVCSTSAFAVCTQTNNTVALLGVEGNGGMVYAQLANHGNQCSCNYARFKSENIDTDKALSILTAAKLSGKTVRVDFNDLQTCEFVKKVYLQ